ncbi:MAG: undecaprenyl-diphosphate phosphatase [Anaerolineae bacterium]|nr:undecaprenyl-diphosphate phosphatase [Anaerolineae bacterium]
MIELIKVILLGIVQGVTEFLPVSSTGHLIVATALLQPDLSAGSIETFQIFIQLGAVVAVIAFFWRDLLTKLLALPKDAATQRFALALIVAFLPAAVVGLLLRSTIKELLYNPTVVAFSLIIGGIVLIVVEKLPFVRANASGSLDFSTVSLPRAVGIGLLQVVAFIPGVSRSAATIIGGMLGGLNRETATAFSFYLAIPTLGLATIFDLLLSLDEVQSTDVPYFLIGAVVSGIVAWIMIRWLLQYVASHTYIPFGIYRILAGIVVLGLVALGLFS